MGVQDRVARCYKCKTNPGSVKNREGSTCKDCFMDIAIHRFKGNVTRDGPMKGRRVLVALSGGPCSSAMLHLVSISNSPEARKRMLMELAVVWVDTGSALGLSKEEREGNLRSIRRVVENHNHILFARRIEEVFEGDREEQEKKMSEFMASCKTLQTKEDAMDMFIRKLLVDTCRHHQYEKLLLGQSATRLAVRVIASTANGRGYSLPLELQYVDSRHEGVKIIRPMKDFLAKEVGFMNHFFGVQSTFIPELTTKILGRAGSINSVTEEFLVNLQQAMPFTMHTVARTGGKLATPNKDGDRRACALCDGYMEPPKETKKGGCSCDDENKEPCSSRSKANNEEFCYGCRTMAAELVDKSVLPEYVADRSFESQREQMKQEIQEFLIESDSEDQAAS